MQSGSLGCAAEGSRGLRLQLYNGHTPSLQPLLSRRASDQQWTLRRIPEDGHDGLSACLAKRYQQLVVFAFEVVCGTVLDP